MTAAKQPNNSRPRPQRPPAASAQPPEVVDPSWLLKALGAIALVGIFCGYLSLCVVFYVQQWQFVLHPSHAAAGSPQTAGLRAQDVQFGDGLRGWWIPAEATPQAGSVLMLPSGDGQASDLLGRARLLHDAGLNVLLFDYRGYGRSAGRRPGQQSMQADSEAALGYLTGPQGATRVLVYGDGVGAALGARLCAEHHELAALIAEAPQGDFTARAAADPRSHIVPFHLLFHESFPLESPLRRLETPKLLVSYGNSEPQAVRGAADPKMLLALASPADDAHWREGLRRFLDTYVTR